MNDTDSTKSKERDVRVMSLEAVEAQEKGREVDAVFGELKQDGPNYRNVGWWTTMIFILKSNVGLGVLGIPWVFQTVGIVPGVILIIAHNFIVMWTAWVLGQTKMRHPEIYAFCDLGLLLGGERFGPLLREALNFVYIVEMVFVCSSACIGISTALNAISSHGTCTAVFVAVAAIAGGMLASIRTLGQLRWLGWVGMASILAAILTVTIAVGVQDRPSLAPQSGPWDKEVQIVASPTASNAFLAVVTVAFSNGAIPIYFGFISEMRRPQDYNKAFISAHIFFNSLFIVIGAVVYYYCGQYVASPALGSAGPLLKKIAYGLALPGLGMTLCLYCHIPAKTLFVRILRDSPHLTSNTKTHWFTWLGCVGSIMLVGYLIASAIPIFGSLIGLVGALFVPITAIIPYGFVWLKESYAGQPKSIAKHATAVWAVLTILTGCVFIVGGAYGTVEDIRASYAAGIGRPWSCADNSNSS